jgi:hypothetical protein
MQSNAISEKELQNQLLIERLNSFSFSDLKAFKTLAIDSYEELIRHAEVMDKLDISDDMNEHIEIVNRVIQRKTMGVFTPPEY